MVTAVSAVNQVDALNRPTEGYSSQSCIKLMELILNDSTLSIEPGSVRMIKLQEDSYLEFVWCPRGAFLMGSPETEPGRAPDEKQHSVTLTKGFFIGKYPITQKQWELITNSNPSVNKVGGFLGVGCQTQPNHPVENVSYADCIHFCEGVNKRLEACSVRLPTEAEWEYACRAGTTTAYAGKCEEMAWFSENSNDSTQKVGRKKPNSWGIHDMHGNVWEWCQDCYSEDYPLNTVDPLNISKQEFYVLRGGSYWSKMENCRSAVRYKGGKFSGEQWRGLRLVLVLK
jgi:formylglycine-generating enzyme required for sulfatase activity